MKGGAELHPLCKKRIFLFAVFQILLLVPNSVAGVRVYIQNATGSTLDKIECDGEGRAYAGTNIADTSWGYFDANWTWGSGDASFTCTVTWGEKTHTWEAFDIGFMAVVWYIKSDGAYYVKFAQTNEQNGWYW